MGDHSREDTAGDEARRSLNKGENTAPRGISRAELFRGVLDETGVIVQVSDYNTHELLYANRAASEYAGKEQGAYRGRKCYEYIMGADAPCAFCVRKELDFGTLSTREIEWGGRCYRVRGKRIRWGGRDAFVEYVDDVTDYNIARKYTEREKNALQAVIDSVDIGVAVLRRRGGVTEVEAVNPSVSQYIDAGQDGERLKVSSMALGSIHPDDRQRLIELVENSFTGTMEAEAQYRVLDGDGKGVIWVLCRGRGVPQGDGTCLAYLTFTDITRQKELEQRLLGSQDNLKLALWHTNLYYWEFDIGTGSARFGMKFQQDFGVPAELPNYPECIFATGSIFPEDVEEYRRNVASVCRGVPYVEWDCRCMDNRQGCFTWRRIYMSVLKDETGAPVRAVATAQSIHEEKERELSFAQSEEQNGIWTWELDLQTKQLRKLGWSEKSVNWPMGNFMDDVPESIIEAGLYHEDSISEVRRAYAEMYGGAQSASAQIRRWAPDKQDYEWFELCFTVLNDGTGRDKAICTSRDISEQKRYERLYQDEQTFRNDLGRSLIANCQVNLTADRVEAIFVGGEDVFSQDMETVTDYRERLGLFLDNIDLSDEDNAMLSPARLLKLDQAGKNSISLSYMAKRRDTGLPAWVKVDCHLLRRPYTGEVIAFFYNKDSTDSYVMDQIAHIALMGELDYAGILFADTGYMRILPENCAEADFMVGAGDAYERGVQRLASTSAVGVKSEDVLSAMALETVIGHLDADGRYSVEWDYLMPDGDTHRKRWRFSYLDKKRRIIAISRTDVESVVQEERKKQELLAKAVKAAEQANAAKTDFLSRMSHEIRTPMNAILGISVLGQDEAGNPAAVKDYFREINEAGSYLLGLINDILDMSRIERGGIDLHEELVNGPDFLSSVEQMIRPLAESKNVRLEVDFSRAQTPWVWMDKMRSQQVYVNLLNNAVKFSPPGSTVEWIMTDEWDDEHSMHMTCIVRDHGCGMSEEFQKQIFVPFAQEHNPYCEQQQGTGLGLSIVKSLVDSMNGDITVESKLGEGSTFTVRLARRIEFVPPQQEKEQNADEQDTALCGKTVLLCEDHPLNTKIAVKLLEKKGIKVICAANGREGVDAFMSSQPGKIDCVLMDIRMPEMNGLEATKAIRASGKADALTVPIIAMTANAFDDDIRHSKEAGMNAHLSKPIDPEKLYLVLAEFM